MSGSTFDVPSDPGEPDPLAGLDDLGDDDLEVSHVDAGDGLDDLAPVDHGAAGLEALEAELTAEQPDTHTFDVPGRPGYAVRYRIDFEHDDLLAWRARARKGLSAKKADRHPELYLLRAALLILANTCDAILRHGEEITVGGDTWTFATPALWDFYGVKSVAAAARAFYGRDGHVLAVSQAVLDEAGYGDEAEESSDDLDPTR